MADELEVVAGEDAGAQETATEVEQVGEDAGRTEEQAGDQGAPDGSEDDQGDSQKREGGYKRKAKRWEARAQEAAREAEYWRNEALRRNGESSKPEQTATASKPKPKPEDFKLDDGVSFDVVAFTEALTDWKAEQKADEIRRQIEDRQQRQQTQSSEQAIAEAYREREDAALEKFEDYDEVANDAIAYLRQRDNPTLRAVGRAVVESENGPEILYHLGQHPEVVEQLRQMTPMAAVIQLGKLGTAVAKEKPPAKPAEKQEEAVSKAPPPVNPVKRTGPAARPFDPNDPNIPHDEWLRLREKQVARKR